MGGGELPYNKYGGARRTFQGIKSAWFWYLLEPFRVFILKKAHSKGFWGTFWRIQPKIEASLTCFKIDTSKRLDIS